MNMISTIRARIREDGDECVITAQEFDQLQAEWITRVMPWASIKDEAPSIGQKVILYSNGVVQEEIYDFDAGEVSDYAPPEYFWDREHDDRIDDGISVKETDMWLPLPASPDQAEHK